MAPGARTTTRKTPRNWSLTVRQELHPDEFYALRAILDNLSQHQPDGAGSNSPGGRALAIPTASGEPVPVADDPVVNPTWAPTGHAIAYVEYPYTMKVVPEPGGEPRELLRANVIGAGDRMRLNWAPDTMLAHVDGDRVLLPVED